MKDTNSSPIKRQLDEEGEHLRDMAREQSQKHDTQVKRKKENPVETLRKKKVEQRPTQRNRQ